METEEESRQARPRNRPIRNRLRGRSRGRGRGRGKAAKESLGNKNVIKKKGKPNGRQSTKLPKEAIEDADVDIHMDMEELCKDDENEQSNDVPPVVDEVVATTTPVTEEIPIQQQKQLSPAAPPPPTPVVLPKIDMEADISQLEAPTFTTLSRGPPEPMLRLKWSNKVNLIGEKVLNPMIHCCDKCDKPVLLYGRMIPCKHVFCMKCSRAETSKICMRCNEKFVRVEQSGLGTMFMCTHGGSRYGRTGCRRTYLSQRDLQAHINHRHVNPLPPPPMGIVGNGGGGVGSVGGEHKVGDLLGIDVLKQRKISESSSLQTPSALLQQQQRTMRSAGVIGSIPPPGSAAAVAAAQNAVHTHSTLTQANLARINNANEQDCHQGKVTLHQSLKKSVGGGSIGGVQQTSEAVADASYYSSVLNSFGSAGVSGSCSASLNQISGGGGYDSSSVSNSISGNWSKSQYYM